MEPSCNKLAIKKLIPYQLFNIRFAELMFYHKCPIRSPTRYVAKVKDILEEKGMAVVLMVQWLVQKTPD